MPYAWILGTTTALLSMIAPAAANSIDQMPQRVVSMNLCTDQLAILVARQGQLYSVSHLAKKPNASVLADEAHQYVTNHGLAEEIFAMQPDLIIAGSYSTHATVFLLKRLGFRVEVFEPAASFEGIRKNIRRMGKVLGRVDQARRLVASFDAAIDVASQKGQYQKLGALYYRNSYTSGGGTLAADIVEHSGLRNLGSELGLKGTMKLPLEVLVMSKPDLIIDRDTPEKTPALASEILTHPALQAISERAEHAAVADRYWICGAPFTAEAVKRLRKHSETTNAAGGQ